MDDPWTVAIIFSFGWAGLAILFLLMPIIVRKWRAKK